MGIKRKRKMVKLSQDQRRRAERLARMKKLEQKILRHIAQRAEIKREFFEIFEDDILEWFLADPSRDPCVGKLGFCRQETHV